jgi:hypothetical protein
MKILKACKRAIIARRVSHLRVFFKKLADQCTGNQHTTFPMHAGQWRSSIIMISGTNATFCKNVVLIFPEKINFVKGNIPHLGNNKFCITQYYVLSVKAIRTLHDLILRL